MTGRNKKLKPTDNFDEIAANLESCGVAFIDIHNEASFIDNFFTTSRAAMDVMKKGNVNNSEEATNEVEPQKDQKHTIDLGHFTGFHYAGCDENHDKRLSSRYNEYREGFIFSDGELLNVSLNEGGEQNDIKDELYFQKTMEKMFDFLHETVAAQTLRAIERRMDIAEEGSSFANKNWLENNFGPTTSSCQWHVKRYIQLHDERQSASAEENEERENNGSEILPMHTDPSLISVIIHDRPGLNEGGFGLQVLTKVENREANNTEKEKSDSSSMKTIAKPKNNTTWNDVPFHGHHVATILVGSVLSLITGGIYPAACHRVIRQQQNNDIDITRQHRSRSAVTLFVRPHPNSILKAPPSPKFNHVKVKNLTFDAWNEKVSKNYMKKKKKQRNRQLKKKNCG